MHSSSQDTAVRPLPGSYTADTSQFYGPPQAVLPRGLGMTWTDDDHKVMQVGLDMGINAISENTISWSAGAKTLLKDDSTQPYQGASIVSILGGNSVRM
jgi:hypothetical protein